MAPGCRHTRGSTIARRNRRVNVLVAGNSPATTHGHEAREDLGEEGPDRWVLAVSVGRAVTGGRSGSRVEMGRGAAEAGRRRGKRAREHFFNLNSFSN
jgi:hypothetical protein